MSMNAESKYPNRRAYVVKVQSDAAPGALHGRVENLLNCQQHEFASGRELVELIETDLQGSDPTAGTR
jgi:hypothetical protein